MEEEKKEEVVETSAVTPVVPTQEEKDENYKKLKKSNNRKKAFIIILIFIIVLMGLLLFIFFTDKKEEPKKEENNQQEKQEEKKEEENKEENKDGDIKYELRQGAETVELYVNGNKVDEVSANGVSEDNIYQIKDALLVVENFDTSRMYMIDKNGKIFDEISGKLDKGTFFNEVKGNEIYYYSYAEIFYQDGSMLCGFKDDDIVYVEEKISYLGDGKFSESQTIGSRTKAQYAKDKDIDCSNN